MDKVRSFVSSLRPCVLGLREGSGWMEKMSHGYISGEIAGGKENAGSMNSRLTVEFVGGIVRFLQKGNCEVEPDAEEGAC